MSDLFPTGKEHVSFSEIKMWKECPYRHFLYQIKKIDLSEPSPFLDFGTAVHEGCESIIHSKPVDTKQLSENIRDAFEKYGFDDEDWINRQPDWYLRSSNVGVENWIKWAKNMWGDVPSFLDETFPGWQPVSVEEQLYEKIPEKSVKFKGFIDAIIKVPNKSGKFIYWIIDWKTANSSGWRREKKQDILMTAQLILYKHFWSRKHDIPLKDIRCGFVLLKRGAKPGKICELVPVSVGPKAIEKATKILNSMISSVEKKFSIKNKNSCTYCPYKNTEHCT